MADLRTRPPQASEVDAFAAMPGELRRIAKEIDRGASPGRRAHIDAAFVRTAADLIEQYVAHLRDMERLLARNVDEVVGG